MNCALLRNALICSSAVFDKSGSPMYIKLSFKGVLYSTTIRFFMDQCSYWCLFTLICCWSEDLKVDKNTWYEFSWGRTASLNHIALCPIPENIWKIQLCLKILDKFCCVGKIFSEFCCYKIWFLSWSREGHTSLQCFLHSWSELPK